MKKLTEEQQRAEIDKIKTAIQQIAYATELIFSVFGGVKGLSDEIDKLLHDPESETDI